MVLAEVTHGTTNKERTSVVSIVMASRQFGLLFGKYILTMRLELKQVFRLELFQEASMKINFFLNSQKQNQFSYQNLTIFKFKIMRHGSGSEITLYLLHKLKSSFGVSSMFIV